MTTVAELIELLKEIPEDAIVEVMDDEGSFFNIDLTECEILDFRDVPKEHSPHCGGRYFLQLHPYTYEDRKKIRSGQT